MRGTVEGNRRGLSRQHLGDLKTVGTQRMTKHKSVYSVTIASSKGLPLAVVHTRRPEIVRLLRDTVGKRHSTRFGTYRIIKHKAML